jgi:hypothetical protein
MPDPPNQHEPVQPVAARRVVADWEYRTAYFYCIARLTGRNLFCHNSFRSFNPPSREVTMVVRYQERFQEMMAQAEVSPDSMRGLLDRLATFVQPFCASLDSTEQRRAAEYLTGLLSGLEHKTAEGIAYLLDQDRQPLQKFIGQSDWDHRPPTDGVNGRGQTYNNKSPGPCILPIPPFRLSCRPDVSSARNSRKMGRIGKLGDL